MSLRVRTLQRVVFAFSSARRVHLARPQTSWLHFNHQNPFAQNHRLSGARHASMTAFLPRTYFFRIFWTVTTGAIGFVSYKVSEASSWAKEKGNLALLSLMSLGLGIMDGGALIKEVIAGWPALSNLLPQPKNSSPVPPPSEQMALAAASSSSEDDKELEVENEQFRDFIKRMIEIRNMLKAAELENTIELPRIVVIGSQSSGKSSVLESIVGHDFLPKGQNMVTRRPLELTLVHTPHANKDYAAFSADGEAIYDFSQIRRKLVELNQSVAESEWVSSEPIGLTVYSKNVPDLTLVDLPGYIQISNKKQPPVLRERIAALCEEYIKGANSIVLAVCPADVDLANAEALKAAQRVDPRGDRTLGVITKLDLVDPEYAAELLKNDEYPLRLGYVGVVCKPGESSSTTKDKFLFQPVFSGLESILGIQSLRRILTGTLEQTIAGSLGDLLYRVQEELDEVKYQLKVEYNDRMITPESYVSGLLGQLKGAFERVKQDLTRQAVRQQVETLLEDHLIWVLEDQLDFQTTDLAILESRLRLAVAALTKSGIGKKTFATLADRLQHDLESALDEKLLSNHPQIKAQLLQEVTAQLKARSRPAADTIENALKPYKHDVEFTAAEWSTARQHLLALLEEKVKCMSERIEKIQQEVGQRRLRKAIQFLAIREEEKEVLSERAAELLAKGREVAELNHRLKVLKRQLDAVENNQSCMIQTSSWLKNFFMSSAPDLSDSPCIKKCPQVYLYMLHTRLQTITALFLHHEIVHEFLDPLLPSLLHAQHPPSDMQALSHGTVSRVAAMKLVSENPVVARHVKLLERRHALETVRERLVYLKQRQEESHK